MNNIISALTWIVDSLYKLHIGICNKTDHYIIIVRMKLKYFINIHVFYHIYAVFM